jgi:seryl-tRNA synthetase
MLDIKFIRQDPQHVQQANNAKNFKVDIDKLLEVDAQLRSLQQKIESLQTQRNQLSSSFSSAKSAEERASLKATVNALKQSMDALQGEFDQHKKIFTSLMLEVAQPARRDVPIGKDDKENVELRTWGKKPEFDFDHEDHIAIGRRLKMIDFERGVKISGSRSYLLTGEGALLERALLNFAYDFLVGRGYTPFAVPVLVNEEAMEGTGYFPVGRDQAYYVEKDKMALVGTAEVPLCSLHGGEILAKKDLPLRYMAASTCFRREAGTYGKDTKGLYRVHQFQKIEMLVIAPADDAQSDVLHDELLDNAEKLLQALGLPYRVVYVCTGDLGQGQVKKHDIETWMPSRDNYGETNSCSSFQDFQARRLNIRYRDEEGKLQVAYTLNNTALATPRLILAILENFQTKDGRVEIPLCLRPYLGGKTHLGSPSS